MDDRACKRRRLNSGPDTPDRFIPSRPPLDSLSLNPTATPPTLSIITPSGAIERQILPQTVKRVLTFTAPPTRQDPLHLDHQRRVCAAHLTLPPSSVARKPPYQAYRVLSAPSYPDDFYLNLVDWSSTDYIAVALGSPHVQSKYSTYIWDRRTGKTAELVDGPSSKKPITSVSCSPSGVHLAVGLDSGDVELWDVVKGKRIRTMSGQTKRIAALNWSGQALSSGSQDGSIWHRDMRIEENKATKLLEHTGEVCGLKWRPDGELLASGGNDNVVKCWDLRLGTSIMPDVGTSKWTKKTHIAAVKALAWCPWQPSVLASGGGSQDKTINLWSANTGNHIKTVDAGSQVTSLIFSPHSKELLSTHGWPKHTIALWSYPTMTKIYDTPAHGERVLCSSLSPDGCSVVTAACDETLRFWKIWEVPIGSKVVRDDSSSRRMLAGIR